MMRISILLVFKLNLISIIFVQISGNTISDEVCPDNTEILRLKIHTGDMWLAGTDDNINVFLRSANGLICRAYRLDNWGNDRERNSVDIYNICCPEEFLNGKRELSMLAVAHMRSSGKNGNTVANDWFIESIEVKANEKIIFNYRFHDWTSPSKKWLFGASKFNDQKYIPF